MDELGARPESLADLYGTIAFNSDEILKLEAFADDIQVNEYVKVIGHFEKAIEIRKTLQGEENKRLLANLLNRSSFYYAEVLDGEGHQSISKEQAKKKAGETIEAAIKIFKELEDEVGVADCLITKGIPYGRGEPQQLKCYKEAEEILLRTVGEIHHSMTRVYINCGVYYEDIRKYDMAFSYFHKYYLLMVELYGIEHTKVIRAIETLREPFYARICRKKGIPVPELPTQQNDEK